MNKASFYILFFLIMFSWLLSGCDKAPHYDPRLQHADSLMNQKPDSALSLLSGIDAKSLSAKSDQAYYALLLTQARYKCYVAATSDSLINVALDYYTHHQGEREKHTRALIYKAAVMDEIGQPQVAMSFFKDAQKSAAPEDYFNQGYIRFRIAQIYNDNYVADSIDIALFKEALRYFQMVPDSFYTLASMSQIGSSYLKTNRDSALAYLYQADWLAKQLQEKFLEQVTLIYIADIKMHSRIHSDIDSAKNIALSILNDPSRNAADDNHLMMIAAFTLAKQGKADSSYYYLSQVQDSSLAPSAQVFYNKCQAEASLAMGDIERYQYHYEHAANLSDSLVSSDLQRKLREVDARYDNEVLKNENMRHKTMIIILVLGALSLLCALAIVILLFSRHTTRRKTQLKEYQNMIGQLHSDNAQLSTILASNQAMNEKLKQTIHHQIDVFKQLVEQHRNYYTKDPKLFSELFVKSYRIKQPGDSFWDGIRSYVDSDFNGIISHTEASCPSLIESDLQFLALYCCGLPTTVIMACMGYNDPHSVYNKRLRVARLLGYDDKLDSYIKQFKGNCRRQ